MRTQKEIKKSIAVYRCKTCNSILKVKKYCGYCQKCFNNKKHMKINPLSKEVENAKNNNYNLSN